MKKTIKITALFLAAAMLFAGCANSSSSSSGDNDKKVDNITFSDGNWNIDVSQKTKYSFDGGSETETYKLHLEVTIKGNDVTYIKGTKQKNDKEEEELDSYAKYEYTKLKDISPEELLEPRDMFLSGEAVSITKYANDDETKFRAKGTASNTVDGATMAAVIVALGGSAGDIPEGNITISYTGEVKYSKQSE